jgi:hypothetical protein
MKPTLSEYEFKLMLGEACARIGKDEVYQCFAPLVQKFGLRIPADKRADVAAAIAVHVLKTERGESG